MTARFANLYGNAKRELPREPMSPAFGLNHPLQAQEQTLLRMTKPSFEAADRLRFASPGASNPLDKESMHTPANTFLKDSLPKPR